MNDKIKFVPLKVNIDERGYYSINPHEGGLTIAGLDILDPYSPVAAAYADLFAAAPEMLSELIKIYTTMYMTQHECYWMPIKLVIERATGRKIDEVIDDRP